MFIGHFALASGALERIIRSTLRISHTFKKKGRDCYCPACSEPLGARFIPVGGLSREPVRPATTIFNSSSVVRSGTVAANCVGLLG